jgi:hypothetical protein
MALLFCDGFDHYATADLTKKWTAAGSGATIGTAGRDGSGNLATTAASAGWAGKSFASVAALVIGVRFKYTSISGNPRLMTLFDGVSQQCELKLNSDGTLSVLRNGTALTDGTSVVSLVAGTYYYLEFKVTVANSIAADSCKVRVNGADVITVAAGQDLQSTANASVSQLRLGAESGVNTAAMLFDDLYICDQSGATNNDFLGDVRIDVVFPNGAGTHQSWTPSTGTDHAALIDETAPNTTDYLTGGAAGSKETSTLQDLSVNGAILAVQVNAALAKTDAGACTTKNLIRSGTTEANGAVFAPSTSYLYSSSIHESDPATGAAWLTSAINALEAGVEVVS